MKRLLLALPTLAALGSFISLSPGSSGTVNGYRVVVALALAPALFTLLRSKPMDVATRWLALTTVAFGTWGAYALSWTPSPELGRRQLIGVLLAIMGSWVAIGITSKHRAYTTSLRHGFVLAAGVLTGIGVWQFATGMNLWSLTGHTLRFAPDMLIGSFINPNNFAAFLLGCAGPVLSWTLTHNGLRRLTGVTLLVAMAFVILGTTSRAGVIALLAIVGCVMLFVMSRAPKMQVPILFTGILVTVAAWAIAGKQITSSLSAAFSGTGSQSDDIRLSLSETAVNYFLESGGLGVGPNGFQGKLAAESSQQILAAHNTFLQVAAEYGYPVFLPFMALVLTIIFACLRRSSTSAGVDPAKIELLSGTIALLVGALVASSLIADPSWWLLIGYLVVLARDSGSSSGPEGNHLRTSTLAARSNTLN